MEIDLKSFKNLRVNLSEENLKTIILKSEKSEKLDSGAIAVYTGEITARSPKDRYIVIDDLTHDSVEWNEYNQPIDELSFEIIKIKVLDELIASDSYLFDGIAGHDTTGQLNIRVITNKASQSLYLNYMFKIDPNAESNTINPNFKPDFTIICAPDLKIKSKDFELPILLDLGNGKFKVKEIKEKSLGLNSEVAIILDFTKRLVVIAGTGYTCEIKKAIFSIFNFLAPKTSALSMHCACNADVNGENSALFFGLSGTGKTTLSSDENRFLVGDDQHAWNDANVYNIENGCYAKVLNLEPSKDAMIYNAIKENCLLENVVIKNGVPDYNDSSISENCRAVIPLRNFVNTVKTHACDHPKNIFFLCADHSGVLPPISILNEQQIKKFFLIGYTSKIGGTENGISEPVPTFSTGFGAPFLPLPSNVYTSILLQKIKQHGISVYLVNTGWSNKTRIPLKLTRTLITGAINGTLKNTNFKKQYFTNLYYPTEFNDLDKNILNPNLSFKNTDEYFEKLKKLSNALNLQYMKY